MKGNNISNRHSPLIMFDIDSLLFEDKADTFVNRIKDALKSDTAKHISRPINKKFTDGILSKVWRYHDVSIGLVTFKMFTDGEIIQLENKLQNEYVPYSQLFNFYDWEELRRFKLSMYTFSNNQELLSYLSTPSAKPISEIWEVL